MNILIILNYNESYQETLGKFDNLIIQLNVFSYIYSEIFRFNTYSSRLQHNNIHNKFYLSLSEVLKFHSK
jgi:hypothetical protein